MTNQSTTPTRSFERYFKTIRHLMTWYESNGKLTQGRANTSFWNVRRKHKKGQEMSMKRLSYSITQTDMTLTQWAFVGPILINDKILGIAETRRNDKEGFVYFWKAVGFLVGINDKFNLCEGSVDHVRRECVAILHQIIRPSMQNPPRHFELMSRSLTKGVCRLIPLLDEEAITDYAYRVMAVSKEIHHPKWQFACINWILGNGFHYYIIGGIIRAFFNSLLRLAITFQIILRSVQFKLPSLLQRRNNPVRQLATKFLNDLGLSNVNPTHAVMVNKTSPR